MKKAIAIILCVIFVFGSVVVWDQADVLASRFNNSDNIYECVAIVLFVAGLCASRFYYDQKKA